MPDTADLRVRTTTAGDNDGFSDKILAAADSPARDGCNPRAPVPRRDAARVLGARAGGAAGAPVPDVLCPERDGDGLLDAERRGDRVRAVAHPGAAGAVPGSDARADRH